MCGWPLHMTIRKRKINNRLKQWLRLQKSCIINRRQQSKLQFCPMLLVNGRLLFRHIGTAIQSSISNWKRHYLSNAKQSQWFVGCVLLSILTSDICLEYYAKDMTHRRFTHPGQITGSSKDYMVTAKSNVLITANPANCFTNHYHLKILQ